MQATVYNLAGEQLESIELDDAIFGITPNMAVVHQAVLRQQANARQGTHNTKTRAHVSGGGAKPWRQKGTGRARQGSNRSPQWRHGGVVFGPHTRSYEQDMPRKMRRLAIRSVLSSKAQEGHVVVIDSFADLEPRTKAMVDVMNKLNIGKDRALILTTEGEDNLRQAAGNLPNVVMQSAHLLSIVDMLKSTYLVLPRASVDLITGILSNNGGRRKLPLRGSSADNGSATPAATAATTTKAKPAAKAPASEAPQTEIAAAPKARKTAAHAAAPAATVAESAPATSDRVGVPGKPEATTTENTSLTTPPPAPSAPVQPGKPEATRTANTSLTTPPPAPAEAETAQTVTISNVQYSGEEYVEIKNNSRSAVDLSGWVVRDQNDADQAFTFPEGTKLEAGDTLQVYTKPGSTYSFNSKRPIWNDKGDALELVDADGNVVSAYAYGSYSESPESEG